MTRTTEQWEQLLEGTTPGPWDTYTVPGELRKPGYVAVEIGDREMPVPPRAGGEGAALDAMLIAAAPAAVAEVVCLRREIAAMRDRFADRAHRDTLLDHFSTVPVTPFLRDLADQLTRILEGDTDE